MNPADKKSMPSRIGDPPLEIAKAEIMLGQLEQKIERYLMIRRIWPYTEFIYGAHHQFSEQRALLFLKSATNSKDILGIPALSQYSNQLTFPLKGSNLTYVHSSIQ